MATSVFQDLKVHWTTWRNRMLGSADFKRWAARFPLTRGIARRRARQTFTLVAGFVYSQVLAACVRCRLLDILADGPASVDDLAPRCSLSPAATERLLRAAASLDLVEVVAPGRYMLGSVGAAIQSDAGITAMVEHHGLLYADLADPLALLRRGGGGASLSAFWPYAERGVSDEATAVAEYSALMAASQPMVAQQVIGAYDFTAHRRLLDVGGGEGAFVAAVGAQAPALSRAVFDLAPVVARVADPTVARYPGSFFDDPLPPGFDLITLIRVLHDHDDAAMLHILRRARAALAPAATLLIAEPMAGLRHDAAMADAYFGFYLLAMGSGRARTPATIRQALSNAGFARSRVVETPLPMIAQVIVATA